jgi:glutaredoxin 2
MKYIVIILFFIFSCKGSIDSGLKNSLLKILVENQKVHEVLLAKADTIPDTKAILDSVKEARSFSEKNEDIKKQLEKMESILTNINSKDKEAFFESLSSFSETLTDILKANQIKTEYNKFYCPMVAKYWVAKGEEIQNPYAPEMRECGELVK